MNILSKAILFVVYAFALPHHFKTFFSPFKRKAENGFSAETISFNLVSVGIGMILRTMVIFTGLIVLCLTLLLLLLLLLLLILFAPICFPVMSFIKSHQKYEVNNLFKQALINPGATLKEILSHKPLGKFILSKLNLTDLTIFNDGQYQETTAPTTLSDFLISLAKYYSPFNHYLQKSLLDETDINRICLWYQSLWPKLKVTQISGFGADWSYGYTPLLEAYQVPQNSTPFPRVVGRNLEIEKIEETLSKTAQNSIIMEGIPGVGRHAIIDEFSRRLFAGNVLPNLVGFRTIYLDLKSAIAAGVKPLDLFEEGRQAGNIILVLDNFENFFALTDILNQSLSEGKLRVIGLTSQELSDHQILQNESLLKLFSIIKIDPPDLETVYLEMELSIVPVFQKEHQVEISYLAIKEAITDADRFVSTVPFPEKAINLLDETISFVKSRHPHMQMLWGGDIDAYLSQKTKIPVGSLSQDQKSKLVNLEAKLHKRVFGQNEAIEALAKALRRSVLNVSSRNKPIGTFLFLGPTGVGKTETAKALAEIYFGDEARLQRLDMSEFQGEIGLERLLDQLPKTLLNNPFAVVLLDEIEKTSPIIMNLFLTLLDEGYITDSLGRKISARENMIIGTSNAGALYIKNRVTDRENLPNLSSDLIKYVQDEKIFSPEFVNRFDGIVVFHPLDDLQIRQVAKKLLAGVAKRIAEKKITLEFSDDLVDRILTQGYDPNFGARSIRRYIQDTVEDEISQKLLSGNFPPGSTLKI